MMHQLVNEKLKINAEDGTDDVMNKD